MKTPRLKTAAAYAFATALAVAAAQDANAQAIKLVTGPDYAPFTDPGLPNGGMITEMVVAAFEAAGVEATEPEFQPWKRGYQAVLENGFDATFPYVKSEERLKEVDYSEGLFDLRTVAVFAGGSSHDYAGPDSVKGLTMCNPIGYAINSEVEPLVKSGDIKVSENKDVAGCLKQIAAGRVDFYIGDQLLVNGEAGKAGVADQIKIGSTPVATISQHVIVGKSNPRAGDILKALNDGLAKLKADGSWQSIVDRHVGG